MMTRYLPGGDIRKLFETEDRVRHSGIPRRASRVEVIDTGPQRGQFFVSFEPLSSAPEHQICLLATFSDYSEAVLAEQRWLEENWILEPLHAC